MRQIQAVGAAHRLPSCVCGGRDGTQIQQQAGRQTGDGDHEAGKTLGRKYSLPAREAQWKSLLGAILIGGGQRREMGLGNPESVSLAAARKLAAEAKGAFEWYDGKAESPP
jgi:hypothetical protein